VKASETLRVAYADPQKSYGHPRNLKQCGLLRSPMAKVELHAIGCITDGVEFLVVLHAASYQEARKRSPSAY
jgi:hypothetical protein